MYSRSQDVCREIICFWFLYGQSVLGEDDENITFHAPFYEGGCVPKTFRPVCLGRA